MEIKCGGTGYNFHFKKTKMMAELHQHVVVAKKQNKKKANVELTKVLPLLRTVSTLISAWS